MVRLEDLTSREIEEYKRIKRGSYPHYPSWESVLVDGVDASIRQFCNERAEAVKCGFFPEVLKYEHPNVSALRDEILYCLCRIRFGKDTCDAEVLFDLALIDEG